jgi:hypothetical protein
MSAELIEDGGAPNVSLRQLPAPTNDPAAKLAAADAAISNIQELLGGVRTSNDDLRQIFDDLKRDRDELRQTLDDLKRDRDEWRARAERLTERPWWRRLAG